MEPIRQLHSYISYLLNAKTKYAIHSPFVFEFVTKVLESKSYSGNTEAIEKIRRRLIADKRNIEFTDLGAGKTRGETIELGLSEIAKNSAKSRKYARLLFNIVHHYKPASIIELGSSLGISTIYLAKANPDANVFTIEGCPAIAEIAMENAKMSGTENIKQFIGNFDQVLEKVLGECPHPELIFFDGNHSKEATLRYFEQCLPYAGNSTMFVFDDIHWSKGMTEAWNNIIAHDSVTSSIDLFQLGIVFFRKELSKQHFIIKY